MELGATWKVSMAGVNEMSFEGPFPPQHCVFLWAEKGSARAVSRSGWWDCSQLHSWGDDISATAGCS